MKRIAVFDNIKFFLIVLMVYGHLANIGCKIPWPVYKIIYSFHMPLFVFMSGYFTKKYDIKYGRTLWNLFLLYAFFCLISWAVNILVYQKPAFTSIFRTPFALWYILCLIYWKTIIHFTPEFILRSRWFIITSIGASILPILIFLDYFSLARCLSFFPFFLLGWLAQENDWIKKLTPPSIFAYHLKYLQCDRNFIIVMSVFCCFIAIIIPTGVYWGLKPVDNSIIVIIGGKLLSIVIAAVNSLIVYLLMPQNRGIEEGQYTLFYYLYHTVLLFPIFDLIVKHIPNTYVMTIVVLFSVVFLLFLLRKIRILNKLLLIGKAAL